MKREVIAAQEAYCKEIGYPMFMPDDGRCFRCNRDITERITVERAGTELITGCPLCHWSYVD